MPDAGIQVIIKITPTDDGRFLAVATNCAGFKAYGTSEEEAKAKLIKELEGRLHHRVAWVCDLPGQVMASKPHFSGEGDDPPAPKDNPQLVAFEHMCTYSKDDELNVKEHMKLVKNEKGYWMTPHERDDTVYISPRAFLRSMFAIAWSAFRHPFTSTRIDLTTGSIVAND